MRLGRSLALSVVGAVAFSACSSEEAETPRRAWQPGHVFPSQREPTARGLLDRRGVIHAHSVNSYDACDGHPRDASGGIDETCFDDLRRGICQAKHDFVMLTEHRDAFESTEFPDVLLYRAGRGDTLVERDGAKVASWAACPGADPVLIMAGLEGGSSTMPVGFERHAAPLAERHDLYGAKTPEAMAAWRAAGAAVLVAHTEGWSVDELATLPLDGFEAYNVHFNAILAPMDLLTVTKLAANDPAELPYSDLALLPFVREIDLYLERWGSVLARGVRRVGTMGTDCHRNSFPALLPDGERLDSYRRMLVAYSNHLLVRPEADGSWDDRHLKEALKSGRLYGSFDYLGYPVGFDFHALEAAEPREMGDEASLAKGVRLVVRRPAVQREDGVVEANAPEVTARLLKAREGGWDEIAKDTADLDVAVTEAGAYRAEIRVRPRHLKPHLSSYAHLVDERDFAWVYANAVYVVP